MKPKLVKADAKAAKLDRALVKTTEQRDEARNQLKVVNSHLKRSQDSLEAANKRIGSLETTISKLKEKPVPPPKMHDNSDLKDLVSKSVKQILEEIKCVRTCHTHLQEAVSALANAPIEITQPTAPQIPAAPRPPPLSAIPQRWQPMSESPSGFQQIVSRDEYHEFAPPARAQNEYWPVPDDRYGAPNRFVPAAYGTPDQIGQHVEGIKVHLEQFGSPIGVGGDLDNASKGIIGAGCASNSETCFLITDPHFTSNRPAGKLELFEGEWIKWASSASFKNGSFYNFCLPQKKAFPIWIFFFLY